MMIEEEHTLARNRKMEQEEHRKMKEHRKLVPDRKRLEKVHKLVEQNKMDRKQVERSPPLVLRQVSYGSSFPSTGFSDSLPFLLACLPRL